MLATDIPSKFALPFAANAASGFIRPIPTTSGDPTVASLTLGFPPNTSVPIGAGGTPPNIQDMNGILQQISAWSQWQAAGGAFPPYDATFSSDVGGYPKGATVGSATTPGLVWLSTVDNNVTNPDTGGAGWNVFTRARLGANTTFYVATTGNDSTGTGLTVGSPWLTVQHAINVLLNLYDLASFTASIQVADGTYTVAAALSAPFVGGAVNIVGNVGSPGNVVFSTSGANCLTASNGGVIGISGVKLQTAISGVGLSAQNGGKIIQNGAIIFGACTTAHVFADIASTITLAAPYTISGSAPFHWWSEDVSVIVVRGLTITLTGTPAFSFFALSRSVASIHCDGNTFIGSATGSRYEVDANGVIQTAAGGPNYLPGSSAGASGSGGQYV